MFTYNILYVRLCKNYNGQTYYIIFLVLPQNGSNVTITLSAYIKSRRVLSFIICPCFSFLYLGKLCRRIKMLSILKVRPLHAISTSKDNSSALTMDDIRIDLDIACFINHELLQ